MTRPADTSFTYTLRPVRVVFADGAFARLGDAIDDAIGAPRLLLVTTAGRRVVSEQAQAALGSRVAAVFDGARLHVPVAVVDKALELARVTTPDCVVAIGGGSAIGLGKALVRELGCPLVAVPTTYSGSEMTDIWGVTGGDRKLTGRDVRVAPRLVVYDPRLTATLPPEVAGPSGMNAVAHAVEAMYSPTGNPVASLLAADGIRRLARSLPAIVAGTDVGRAAADALCGAHYCGRALDMTSMGLHHKLCHVLGGTFGLPHALTHAIVLPHVTAYNAAAASDAMAVVAASLNEADAAMGLWRLNRTLGITQTLADLGIGPRDVDRIVDLATTQTYPNPAPVTSGGLRRLLERAILGDPPMSPRPETRAR